MSFDYRHNAKVKFANQPCLTFDLATVTLKMFKMVLSDNKLVFQGSNVQMFINFNYNVYKHHLNMLKVEFDNQPCMTLRQ